MRHLKAGRKFGRNPAHRRAMFRNLAANLILNERIETTDAKAKELRRVTERLITKAKRIGEAAYTKPPAQLPSDPGEAKKVRDAMARRLHVERLLKSKLPRFGVRTLPDGTTEKVDLIEKVLVDLAKRFKDRKGGYTRIIKLGPRKGDNAPMSIIEFVDRAEGDSDKDDREVVDAVLPDQEEKKEEAKAEENAESESKEEAKAEENAESDSEEEAKAEEKSED